MSSEKPTFYCRNCAYGRDVIVKSPHPPEVDGKITGEMLIEAIRMRCLDNKEALYDDFVEIIEEKTGAKVEPEGNFINLADKSAVCSQPGMYKPRE